MFGNGVLRSFAIGDDRRGRFVRSIERRLVPS
jgi:hypothetical protein